MDFNGIGFEDVYWIHLALDRVHCRAIIKKIMSLWILLKKNFCNTK
jgi:hypothetical protein